MKYLIVFLLCLQGFAGKVFSQTNGSVQNLKPGEILLDARLIRGQFGYTQMQLSKADTFSSRIVDAVNLKAEFQLLSTLFGYYNRFVIYDALYTEMLFGKMRNDPIQRGKSDIESKFSFGFRWGYDIFAGYRTKKYGILAGIRPRWMTVRIGDLTMGGNSLGYFLYTMPFAVKGEYRLGFHNEFRIMLTLWDNFMAKNGNRGARLEIPCNPHGRWWVFGEYETYNNSVDYVFGINPNNADYKTLTVGIRVGGMY